MNALVNPGPLLPGSNVVVTGGGKGIGRGIVDSFVAHGANVLCVDSDVDESLAAAERATDQLRVLDLDVTASSAAEVIAQHCDADVVVNNVGHFLRPPRNFAEEAQQDWDELFRVNLDHVFRVTAGLLPGMISRDNGGSVITLTTVEAFRGIPGHAAYSAANAGLTGWTRSMALENGKHGIRFNAIAPDLIETPQVPYHQLVEQDDWWRWRMWAPLGRPGTPADVAGAALFLASPLSTFVTGTTIHVDGGSLAAGGWFPREDGSWTNRAYQP